LIQGLSFDQAGKAVLHLEPLCALKFSLLLSSTAAKSYWVSGELGNYA
jgi:hypothetical protein